MADLRWFDPKATEPAQTFDLLPAGDYECVIEESEVVDTKNRDGKRLKLTFQVVIGKYKGRKLREGLNIVNRSEKAQEIARGQLSAICRAVGVLTPDDTSDLHNIPLLVSVGIGVNNENGENINRIKGYKPLNGKVDNTVVKPPERQQQAVAPVQGGDLDIPF